MKKINLLLSLILFITITGCDNLRDDTTEVSSSTNEEEKNSMTKLQEENDKLKKEIENLQTRIDSLEESNFQFENTIHDKKKIIMPDTDEIIFDQKIPFEILEIFQTYINALETNDVKLMNTILAYQPQPTNLSYLTGYTEESIKNNSNTEYKLISLRGPHEEGEDTIYVQVEFEYVTEDNVIESVGGIFTLQSLEAYNYVWKIVKQT
ncbi:hypothetical protein [Longirhabdus pacifica]|uniref:hypothetical protein n=1 Tax=Longirhabdus pacifica TaxID=2305227 RepID=UPI00100934E5|nr:hypothetical protein [Longirhabdus pacifica]